MNIWQDVISVVGKAAPLVATALGGPAAGTMVAMVTSLLGLNKDASPSDILNHINNNPDSMLQLQRLNQGIEWAKIDAQNFQVETTDRQSARQMQQSTNSKIPEVLAFTFAATFLVINIICLFLSSPAHDIISARIQDIVIMIVSFYFCSSYKKQKDPRMENEDGN